MYLNDDDSSPESSSVTPRTPSPDNAACANRYTLVQTRRLSDVLRSGQSRSPPPPKSREDRDSHSHIGAPILSDAIHFVIKRIGQPRYRHVAFQNVHVLSCEEKLSMLGAQPDADADPSELMQRLSRLDLNVSSKFIVKPDMKKAFVFRLIYDHREVVKDHHQTFIALSYRRKHHVEKHHGFFTLPLDDEMFQAVWDERVANEGVWIDQICIKQESREETTTSMSAMDMVYRSARLVVVALDDIELNADERGVLERHMEEYTQMLHVSASKRFRGKQPAYLETHDDLFQLLCKIFGSSWFRRAWCRHEMRLARDHVFLIPCKSLEPTGKSIVRFTNVAANRHFGSMADVYTQTLACVLECGPDWVEDVCLHYGVGRWKQDGEGAWNLLVALKNTGGRWPESAWNAQAAGFIADFVNFLVIRGMPQRQILHREEWRPIWVSRKDGGKIITFVPPGEIEAAVPAALLDDDYIQLARLWLLQPRTLSGAAGDPTCRWTLLGKSVIFSDSPALQEAHTGRTDIRDQQRVFGREDPEIQRLLRERSLYY
ncbi:hypothetical protein LTR48_000087 [Friedmanniomyces endolithicus]|uniref:Heterokaryon incompatibility domain-containing protein n=1 Tax=Rachicladosporium monterosium TaxID=1507873 RepID=A0ABR0L8B4_9PEZI|nr:hypothetical protein LTR48_000087 [Friedmanniomyces endolithicus]KAK5144239.1 hypothetical protein LTR32_003789 [Rachicladosporium monterosium]